MINNLAFHKLLDAADETIRLGDLRRLYAYMLTKKGKIIAVRKMAEGSYFVQISFDGVTDFHGVTVVMPSTAEVILKPVKKKED